MKLFILNEAIEPIPIKPSYHNIRSKQLYVALKALTITAIITASTMQVIETRRMMKDYYASTRESLSGEFEVIIYPQWENRAARTTGYASVEKNTIQK